MAGFKVSEFSGVANTTDDSLLLLSYTTDNGATFATRKIRIADFLDDIAPTTKADVGVDHLETLTGAGADAENLGTFAGTTIADNVTIKQALTLLENAVEGKQAIITDGNGLAFTGDTLDIDLATGVSALESFTLSGMSDSNHNDTYTVVTNGGSKLKAHASQSGAQVIFDIQREAEYTITLSTSLGAVNNTVTVIKHSGYLSRSGDTYTWNNGSTGGYFRYYYWNSTTETLLAYNGTDGRYEAFDLSQATGNAASFISDLNSTSTSLVGYVSGGENFTLTGANLATVTTLEQVYDGSLIIRIPSDTASEVTYGTASVHPYYVFQNAAANKWVAKQEGGYWTAWYRSAAFDLNTQSLTDDQAAFSLDSTSAFEYITGADDQHGDGTYIPDAADANVTYLSASPDSFLEFASGKLKVRTLDEDDFASNSDTHVPTQQSVKAYVDAQNILDQSSAASLYVRLDGASSLAGDLNLNSNKLTNVATPTVSTDGVNKSYVDTATAGIGVFWAPVEAEADSNITLSGTQTVDGYALSAGDRVLVDNQSDATQNGIYVVAAGAWSRAADANEAGEWLRNKTVFVKFGDTNSGNVYAYTGSDSPTVGSDALTFELKSTAAQIADGSITAAKLASGSVTDAKIVSMAATKLTGVIDDARIGASSVTQHQGALSVGFTQLTGTIANAQVPSGAVTQHQASLSITKSQISDFSDSDYFSATLGQAVQVEQAAQRQTLGGSTNDTTLGTFTGSIISDSVSVRTAFQEVETAIETLQISDLTDGGNVVEAGDNVNRLVGSTGADGEPASYLFVVCDQSDGSLKFIDKTFIEIE